MIGANPTTKNISPTRIWCNLPSMTQRHMSIRAAPLCGRLLQSLPWPIGYPSANHWGRLYYLQYYGSNPVLSAILWF